METISIPQLARALGLSRSHVARLARSGVISAWRNPTPLRGGRWRIARDAADAFIRSCGLDPAQVLPPPRGPGDQP